MAAHDVPAAARAAQWLTPPALGMYACPFSFELMRSARAGTETGGNDLKLDATTDLNAFGAKWPYGDSDARTEYVHLGFLTQYHQVRASSPASPQQVYLLPPTSAALLRASQVSGPGPCRSLCRRDRA